MSRVPTNPLPPPSPSPSVSMVSIIRAYAFPAILFAGAMVYQLFLIPSAFPPSHYDVLQIQRHGSIDNVKEAYDKLQSKWNSAAEVSDVDEFLKIRYAYELLTNPLWKRDYDLFGIDEHLPIIERASKRYAGKSISQLDLPLLDAPSFDSIGNFGKVITASDFKSIFQDRKPWLVQLYSSGSNRCAEFAESWNKIASFLDAFANFGVVELGEKELALNFAEKRSTGKPFFRNGIPSLVAIPRGCRSAKCFSRFDGELTIDKVTNWFATTVLALPQINYYTKESLVPNFFGKTSAHKVKVIFFSKTGERATPFFRQVAKDYWAYASFAFILWREEESSYWLGAFGVDSAPAIVFLKDPGVKPVVHHGSLNNSLFLSMMENNKEHEVPQLRSATSMELGCDPRGYSRAGYDSAIWYCVIAVGRPSLALNKMREIMCRVQETLSKHSKIDTSSESEALAPAVDALNRKRLTFTWLDGEKQKDYCKFYLGAGGSENACGPPKGMTEIPRLVVIRYLRNDTALEMKAQEMPEWKSYLVKDLINESDQAGQFVAGYKGTEDASEIIHWLANLIKDGDSRDLPFFTLNTPRLVPDDTEPIWSRTVQQFPLQSLKQKILSSVGGLSVYLEDPRIGPSLLLGALISFGTIWLKRSQQSQQSRSKQPNQTSSEEPSEDERKQRRRDRVRSRASKNMPPSMTDSEPMDAYQMPLIDSDSD